VRVEQRKAAAGDLRSIFNAPSRDEADRFLAQAVKKYSQSAPRLSSWMEENISQGLTVSSFPAEHHKRLRTTNLCEHANREIKRRARVVGVFPNARSLERLVTAVLMEMSEDWQSGARYLTFS
jgi:putative transposase